MEKKNDEKKPYRSPQITRIVLRREQAVLTNCSTSTTNDSSRTGTKCSSTCRRISSGTASTVKS